MITMGVIIYHSNHRNPKHPLYTWTQIRAESRIVTGSCSILFYESGPIRLKGTLITKLAKPGTKLEFDCVHLDYRETRNEKDFWVVSHIDGVAVNDTELFTGQVFSIGKNEKVVIYKSKLGEIYIETYK